MISTNRIIILLTLLWTFACAYGQDVHYNYDRGTNFSAYKTYQWVDLDGRVPDQLIDSDIKRAVDEQLTQKGLTKVEKNADLYVGYEAVVNLEKGVNLSGFGTRGGPGGWGWGGLDSGTVTGQTSTIPVGVLLVNQAVGLARRCEQDHRPQKGPRQELQEPAKSYGETF